MGTIRGYGVYLPLYRIERSSIADQYGDYAGGGETAVPAHDEGIVSMAVSAATAAIEHAADPDVDAVFAATTSDPFDERGLASHVAVAVDADERTRVGDFQGSARAATNAVLSARDAVEAGRAENALVVAADVLTADAGESAERTAGAGAGAIVLGDGDEDSDEDDDRAPVAELNGTASATTGFVGRFKRSGESPVEGDARFERERGYLEAVPAAIEALREDEDPTPDHAVMPDPDGGWGARALSAADIETEIRGTFDEIGYAGAASALIDLSSAFDRAGPDERVLATAYGPGGSDAVRLTTRAGVDRAPGMTVEEYVASKEYVSYAAHRRNREPLGGEN